MDARKNLHMSGWLVAVLGVVLINSLPGCGDQPVAPTPLTQQVGTNTGDVELKSSDVATSGEMAPQKSCPRPAR